VRSCGLGSRGTGHDSSEDGNKMSGFMERWGGDLPRRGLVLCCSLCVVADEPNKKEQQSKIQENEAEGLFRVCL